MLDSIQIGMVRLKDDGEAIGYMRKTKKDDPDGPVHSYFRIPLYVVFDLEGYNTYKEYLRKENPEFKTWISHAVLKIPPSENDAKMCIQAGSEMFLGMVRTLAQQAPKSFPQKLRVQTEESIQKYVEAKKNSPPAPEDDEYDEYVPPQELVAAEEAVKIYGALQRSRFDSGRPQRKGEFLLAPFVRNKKDKTAREVIIESTNLVFNYLLENPKVSKYSECEGRGLRIKLTSLFMECLYKEQIHFMAKKLNLPSPFARSRKKTPQQVNQKKRP